MELCLKIDIDAYSLKVTYRYIFNTVKRVFVDLKKKKKHFYHSYNSDRRHKTTVNHLL